MRDIPATPEVESQIRSAADALFAGPGEIRALCRAIDWARTPIGAVEGWPEAICATMRLCLDSGFPMGVYVGPELVVVYNEAFAQALSSGKHPAALGRPAREMLPAVWERIGPQFTQVLAGGPAVHFRNEPFPVTHDGRTEERFWTYALSPVQTKSGAVVGVHSVVAETTAHLRAEAALRESEEEYRTLFTEMDQGFCIIERTEAPAGAPVDFRYIIANPAFEQHTGMHDVIGKTIRELVPNADEKIFDIYDEVVRSGERAEFEAYVTPLNMWMAAEVLPARLPGQISVLFSNITVRKRAELGLHESEERQIFLLGLSDMLRTLRDSTAIQQAAAQALGEWLGADGVGYGELDIDRRHTLIEPGWTREGVYSIVGRFNVREFGAILTAMLSAGNVAVVQDARDDRRISPDEYDRNWAVIGVRSAIAVPITEDAAIVAVLLVHSVVPRGWTDAEVALAVEVAQRTWAEVTRARAEEAQRDADARLTAELIDTQLLYEISSSLIKENNADALYGQFLDGARALLHSDMASIQVLVPELNELFLAREQGFAPESAEFWQWVDASERTSCGLAFARGEPVVVPDVERWSFVAGTPNLDHYRLCGIRAVLSVPLISRAGRVVGVISTHWRAVHEASEREVRLLTVLARQAADLVEWRAADKALRETETRYRILVDNVLDYAIMLLDVDGIITEWTPGAEKVKGYAADEALGQHFRIFYQKRDRDGGVPEHELARAAELGRAENEGWRVRKDGTRFWADEILTAVHDHRGTVVGFTKITRDLTHRMLVEAAAERQRQDMERDEFRRQLAAVEENERRRLSRELHDQLGQHLAALSLGLDEVRRSVGDGRDGNGRPRIATRIQTLQRLATTLTIDARNLALELRPPELDDVGLASALETLVSRWSAHTGVTADLEISGLDGAPVASDAGSAVFRIVQQALANVAKHAGATRVSVIVEPAHDGMRLIVEDDGCGFDPAITLTRARMESRLGIIGMRERATLVGGTLAVESAPGSGTTIYVAIPNAPPASHAARSVTSNNRAPASRENS